MVDIIMISILGVILIGSGIIWIFYQEKYWAYREKEVKVYQPLQVAGVFQILLGLLMVYFVVKSNM